MIPSDVLMELFKNPRHRRVPDGWNVKREEANRACGDRVTLYLRVEGGAILDAGFEAEGCSLTLSSAELLCRSVVGGDVEGARGLTRIFFGVIDGALDPPGARQPAPFAAFLPLRDLPLRRRCATLAWENLTAALDLKDTQ